MYTVVHSWPVGHKLHRPLSVGVRLIKCMHTYNTRRVDRWSLMRREGLGIVTWDLSQMQLKSFQEDLTIYWDYDSGFF
jgi:hypothetical protein